MSIPTGIDRIAGINSRARIGMFSNLTRLISLLQRLPSTPLIERLLNHAIRLRDKIQQGRPLSSKELAAFEDLLKIFTENRDLDPQDRKIVETIGKEIVVLREDAETREQRLPPNNRNSQALTPDQTTQVNGHESIVRGQILSNDRFEININLHDINISQTISLGRAFDLLNRQDLSAEQLAAQLPRETRTERSTAASELLARVLFHSVIDRMIREIVRQSQQEGRVDVRAIENLVRDINREMRLAPMEIKTTTETTGRKAKDVDALFAEREQERRGEERTEQAARDNRLVCEVVYDREGNVVRVEVRGRLEQRDLVRTTRELMDRKPADTLPQLIETAIRAISREPAKRAEIVNFISELFARTPNAAEAGKANAPRPVAVPAARPQQQIAGNIGWASEPILVELIRSLLVEPKQIVEQQFASVNNNRQITPQAATELAATILSQSAREALPVLLKEHAKVARTNPTARAALEQVIAQVSQTSAAREYVMAAFAKGETQPLVSSEIGHKVVVQTVQAIMAEARQQQTQAKAASASLKSRSQQEQLTAISQMIASANYAKLPSEQLTIKTARAFLEFVAQTQKVIKIIGPRNLSKLEKIEAKQSKQPVRSTPLGGKSARKKAPAKMSRTVRSRQALRELIQNAEDANLLIPKHLFYIIGNHYAGLAGLTGIRDRKVMRPYEANERAPEARATSSLRRVLAAMEVDLARAVSRNTVAPAATTTASSLSAEVLVYGLVMRRVRAEIEKADEMIKALKKHGLLGMLVKAVQEGEADSVIDFINNVAMQAELLSRDSELTEASLSAAIERIIEADTQPEAIAA
ncbi:MAG: hypothetical protein JW782_00255 [Candidatus Saganbacteria bacterium]|nr:hypothetical protein [Candidatus Saganbacteria bacterium]